MIISNKIIEYKETRDEQVFNSIYESVHKGGKTVRALARKYRLDESEVESEINFKLLDLIDSYDIERGRFENFFSNAISRLCIDLVNKQTRIDQGLTEVMIEIEETGEYEEIYEVTQVAPTTTEDDILTEVRKRRDQRQLIANLMEKADEPTKLSISAFLKTDSYRQAAKLVGTCHKTVKARIERLSRNFDNNKYGETIDYLTVPTTQAV